MKISVYRKLVQSQGEAPAGAAKWSAKRRSCEPAAVSFPCSKFLTTRRCGPMPYEVTFDAAGGQAEYVSKVGTVAEKIGSLPTATYADKHFSGWFTQQGAAVTPDTLVSVATKNLHAVWIDPTAIAFDANGGSSAATSTTMYVGVEISGLDQTATGPADRPNFIGWYTSAEGGTKIKNGMVYDGSFTVLYAHYAAQTYEVVLNDQWFLDSRTGTDPNGKAYGMQYSANPDQNAYDGTYISYSNYNVNSGWAKMRVSFIGYTEFVVYIRSYAESSYDYTVIGNVDQNITSNPSSGYSSTSGSQTSGTAISNYKKVTYSGLDGGQHFVDIVFRKDGSVNTAEDRGYVLIPKDQNA